MRIHKLLREIMQGISIILILLAGLLIPFLWQTDVPEDGQDKNERESRKTEAESTLQRVICSIPENYRARKAVDDILVYMEHQRYTVGMADNSVDLRNNEKIESFCNLLLFGQEGQVCVYLISSENYLQQFDFTYKDDTLKVIITGCGISETEAPEMDYKEIENAEWKYSANGWFFFSSASAADEEDCSAIKVTEMNPEYRELCKKYIDPVGYRDNNFFITDWNTENLGELNILDLFDILLAQNDMPEENGMFPDGVPAGVMEDVLLSYLDITVEQIRQQTSYDADKETYWWRKREAAEHCTQSLPVPEVRNCVENKDGTITLTVAAVWKERKTDYAFVHDTTIRVLENGKFQYLSNKVRIQESIQYPKYIARIDG